MGNVFDIGKSALRTANYNISTVSHNVANATTEGYNRQKVIQANVGGQRYGYGFIGSGVKVTDVRRLYDEIVGKQYRDTQSEASELGTYYAQIQKINNKLADKTAGLSPALQDFFSAVQEIASTPTSAATREAMLSEAQILVGRVNNLSDQLNEQRALVNAEMVNSVSLINSYATEIAHLNEQISRAQITDQDPAPNDLLDQRDLLIQKLSEEIGVRVVENERNLDVYVGNGQPIVLTNQALPMYAEQSTKDPDRIEIGYYDINHLKIEISDRLLTGGNLKGYMEYRDNELDPILNDLGLLALNISYDFNEQHRLGQDLNGDMGENFFSFATHSSIANRSSTGSVAADVQFGINPATGVDYVKELTSSNYRIDYDGTAYKITRQSDGTVWDGLDLSDPVNKPVIIDGLKFSATKLQPGDALILKPMNDVGESLKLLITDTNKIAAASPVRTAFDGTNRGTGEITLGNVNGTPLLGQDVKALTGQPFGFPDAANPYTLTYDKTKNAFVTTQDILYSTQESTTTSPVLTRTANGFYSDQPVTVTDGGNTKTYQPGEDIPYKVGNSYDINGQITYTLAGKGADVPYIEGAIYDFGNFNFIITGEPESGDKFSIEQNTNGTGDNRNMLLLAALQSSNTMLGGTTSYQGSYSQLVNRVGTKTQELQVLSTSKDTLLNEIYEEIQSQSGVNLDDEAVDLMRHQQVYQAAAQVLQTANSMFDSVLGIFR